MRTHIKNIKVLLEISRKSTLSQRNNKTLTSSAVKNLTNKTKALVKDISATPNTRFVTEYDKYGRSLTR